MQESDQRKSKLIEDEAIRSLLEWVTKNGGQHRVCVREDSNGVRGLYAAQAFNIDHVIQDEEEDADVVVKVPNKLLITPYHVSNLYYVDRDCKHHYKEIFDQFPEVFDPKFEYKKNHTMKSKIDNEYADYFQLTFFLIAEKLKGKQSNFEPFVNYLPKEIHTLYTYPDDTKIHPRSQSTLMDELQCKSDDIHEKIQQDREYHQECKDRFLQFIKSNTSMLNQLTELDFKSVDEEMFDWAWMNVGTRCFGTHHFPASIAMVPLIDLINHSICSEKMRFYLYPLNLGIKMVERGDTEKINKELALDYEAEKGEDQDMGVEWESQDMDQHWDDYGDFHYNYMPRPKKEKVVDSDEEEEKDEDKFIQQDPIEKVWDLHSDKIFISKKLLNKKSTQIEEGEQLHLSYGERANSFLLIEYGFTIPDNRYDFVRLQGINIQKVWTAMDALHIQRDLSKDQVFQNLEQLRMRDHIRIDMKLSGLHRDLIRFIRCCLPKQKTDSEVLKIYKQICEQRQNEYQTSLEEDRQLLLKVSESNEYHWIYQYVIIYRIGQKEIIRRQITFCDMLIDILNESGGDYDMILEKGANLKQSNNMLEYFQDLKETYFK